MDYSMKGESISAKLSTDISGSEFLGIVEAALLLAFEAGKWEGQVELEEFTSE